MGWTDYIVQTPKEYSAINRGEIVPKWTRDLSRAIIKVLEGCSWSYFLPIQIRFEREEGITIALQCLQILRAYRICGVEVEIREGKYERHAASTKLEREFGTVPWEQITKRINIAALPMSSSLGYSIGYLEDRIGRGTLGLCLMLGDKNLTIYGLTCHHVVHNYRAPGESFPGEGGHQYRLLTAPKFIREKKERVIDHLSFHPKYEISSQEPGYLKDWALIELDPNKFINGPRNDVYVGDSPEAESRCYSVINQGFLTLSLQNEKGYDDSCDGRSARVFKRGATTGLTRGTRSGVEAVTPHVAGDRTTYSWEPLIISESEKLPFFAKRRFGLLCLRL
ncbi:hypothetical protein GGR58DRAFT_507136 [Xylaria digitata]|nr:hypothetical protein GGR58DRAFT_507136 [Xylaria digitata]